MHVIQFTLRGPMAAWGDLAAGERRSTETFPGRSHIIGLLGYAMGYGDHDRAALADLDERVGYAVRINHIGGFIEDYHTVATRTGGSKVRWNTRRDEVLNANRTIVTWRSYLADVDYTVWCWCEAEGLVGQLMEALKKPADRLHLGRVCCPLSAPLSPLRVDVMPRWVDGFAEPGGPFEVEGRAIERRRRLYHRNGWQHEKSKIYRTKTEAGKDEQ